MDPRAPAPFQRSVFVSCAHILFTTSCNWNSASVACEGRHVLSKSYATTATGRAEVGRETGLLNVSELDLRPL